MNSIFDEFDVRALKVFSRGESFDVDGFAELFSAAPVYQFGNAAPCLDGASIRQAVASFFDLVEALYHDVKTIQTVGETAFVEMDVHYWRKRGGPVVLPCLDVFRFDAEGKVAELRIGMDAAPAGDPQADASRAGSVFGGAHGSRLQSRHPMRRYFAEHPDGRSRVTGGHAPRWTTTGPRWAIARIDQS